MATPLNRSEKLVVAIGGNATHPEDITGTSEEQTLVAARSAQALLPLALLENELIITHGNGPVVGKILMRQVLTRDRIAPMPLDICVAHSQGGIAYLLVQSLENALREAGNDRHVACLLTQVEVSKDDPAFDNPTKPIGQFYSASEAAKISEELGWIMKEDSGRGWRHVVPSPQPQHICDVSLVDVLSKRGSIVIAAGGGGIPVVRESNGVRHGISAVIDKDLTSAKLANVLNADVLMMLTAVPRVAINFGKPDQRELEQVTANELERYLHDGQFPAGSMGPKIQGSIEFLRSGGKRVVIAHLNEAEAAYRGDAGTQIIPD